MPQRSVYIKEEDDAKWRALPNKAEFIHNALNPLDKLNAKVHDLNYLEVQDTLNAVKNMEVEGLKIPGVVLAKDLPKPSRKLCRHGNPMGQCFDKGADRKCRL